ncbi:MAG: GNAT family N-acetyltransferase [Spirochaetia bacterium]|nr:GNAT family N-acetyltransferase [Spirochaetia bacterium]
MKEIESIANLSWPAIEEITCDNWLLRASGGYTRRSNCAAPLSEVCINDLDAVLPSIIHWFRNRKLPPTIKICTTLDNSKEFEERLTVAGFFKTAPSCMMTRSNLQESIPSPQVRVTHEPDDTWLQAFLHWNGLFDKREQIQALLACVSQSRAYFSSVGTETLASLALGIITNNHFGIFDFVVNPAFRRNGQGRSLLSSMLAWAAHNGAHAAFLQVLSENHAAQSLYAQFGFAVAFDYSYFLCE